MHVDPDAFEYRTLLQYAARLCRADVCCRVNIEEESLVHELTSGRRHGIDEPGVAAIEFLK